MTRSLSTGDDDDALPNRVGPSLPFTDPRHLTAAHWLTDEVWLLAAQVTQATAREEWLGLLTDDVQYRMTVRVTTAVGAGYDTCPGMDHQHDTNKEEVRQRHAPVNPSHAGGEGPPSRRGHLLLNVRTFVTETRDHLIVESALVLNRSLGDRSGSVTVGREDVLRQTAAGWKLARRTITPDDAIIPMWNLAVFL